MGLAIMHLQAFQKLGKLWRVATTSLGISPAVGRLTLNQETEVRTLHPQPFPSLSFMEQSSSRTLIAGPTGSGKSTTIYASLVELISS